MEPKGCWGRPSRSTYVFVEPGRLTTVLAQHRSISLFILKSLQVQETLRSRLRKRKLRSNPGEMSVALFSFKVLKTNMLHTWGSGQGAGSSSPIRESCVRERIYSRVLVPPSLPPTRIAMTLEENN